MLIERQAKSVAEFNSLVAQGYYKAESYIPRGTSGDSSFKLDITQAGAMPICRFRGIDIGVRRNWKHIRGAASGLYVVWFPLEGEVSVTQNDVHDVIARPGSLIITCGDRPFHIKVAADGAAHWASQVHVLVPSHIIRTYLPDVDKLCGRAFGAQAGAAAIGREIFSQLVCEASRTSDHSAERLGLAALEAIADSIKREAGDVLDGVDDNKRARLQRILSYIQRHLATQGLTADQVAGACNVSRRYLHYLMKHNNTTFGEYLWECRLQQANVWLNDPEFRHFNIVDIAYMAGFRSASHFSHAYRNRYGFPPRACRGGIAGTAAPGLPDLELPDDFV